MKTVHQAAGMVWRDIWKRILLGSKCEAELAPDLNISRQIHLTTKRAPDLPLVAGTMTSS